MLVHARRTGLLPEVYRTRVFSIRNPFSVGTYLVDGRVVGAWSVHDGHLATGIGRITIDFRVDDISAKGDVMQMVFWASIDGLAGMAPTRIDLDLLGLGVDAHDALREGVHALADSVIPVLRFDHDRRTDLDGVTVMQVTSLTDGRATSWDLMSGRPGVGGEPRALILAAIDDLALTQGIIDSIVPALGEIRPHWFKLFLVRADDGRFLGDFKVDGVAVGVAESFDSPKWPAGGMVVRQFGLARPSGRAPDATHLETLGAAPKAPEPSRWWQRRVREPPR